MNHTPRNVIWRWTPPVELQSELIQDCAEEYAVEEAKDALGGVILWARYKGKWDCNPWMARHVIGELISQLSESEAALKNANEVCAGDRGQA